MSEGGASIAGAGMSTGGNGNGAGGAGGAGTAGQGTGGSATYDVPRGASAGCGKDATDEPGKYVKHELDVKGVDPAFEMAHPLSPGNNGGYTYERRNYFIQLPPGYDKTKPYPLTIGGSGCGDTSGLSGRNGGQQPSGMTAIKVGLSYVYSGGACFEDGYENTPEVPYFDAVLAELEDSYCIDKEKVFLSGFSSGSWEAITLGLARGGIVRGIATGAGGLREKRPTPSRIPMAAILLTGKNDGANPIDGPTGSAAARDLILATNGCVGTDTKAFAGDADCKQYTGCPATFPVVWCEPAGEHMAGSDAHWKAVGEFWSALPAVP
jgi:polyhydroxybutyrate depolymerase